MHSIRGSEAKPIMKFDPECVQLERIHIYRRSDSLARAPWVILGLHVAEHAGRQGVWHCETSTTYVLSGGDESQDAFADRAVLLCSVDPHALQRSIISLS